MSLLLAFIFAIAPLSTQAMNASLEAPATTHEALLEAPIKAPVEAKVDAPEVEVHTSPAPAVEAPIEAPVEDHCEEDMECWEGSPNDDREYYTAPHAPETTTASSEDAAWLSIQSLNVEHLDGLALKYYRTQTAPPTRLDGSQFPVQDTETEGVWHIFGYVPEYDA